MKTAAEKSWRSHELHLLIKAAAYQAERKNELKALLKKACDRQGLLEKVAARFAPVSLAKARSAARAGVRPIVSSRQLANRARYRASMSPAPAPVARPSGLRPFRVTQSQISQIRSMGAKPPIRTGPAPGATPGMLPNGTPMQPRVATPQPKAPNRLQRAIGRRGGTGRLYDNGTGIRGWWDTVTGRNTENFFGRAEVDGRALTRAEKAQYIENGRRLYAKNTKSMPAVRVRDRATLTSAESGSFAPKTWIQQQQLDNAFSREAARLRGNTIRARSRLGAAAAVPLVAGVGLYGMS